MAKSDVEPNLLNKLHRWARRQDENFTTDSFVHLLQYLLRHEPEAGRRLVAALTGSRSPSWLPLDACKNVNVRSQAPTNYGTPDIEISRKDHFCIFVEVKVGSEVRKEQLNKYKKALKEKSEPHVQLVLLTKKRVNDLRIPDGVEPVLWTKITAELGRLKKDIPASRIGSYLIRQVLEFFKQQNFLESGVKSKITEKIFNVWAVSLKKGSWSEIDNFRIRKDLVWSSPERGVEGDLIVAYRTKPAKIIQDIFALTEDSHYYPDPGYFGWMASYRRIAQLENPISYDELGANASLKKVQNLLLRQKVSEQWPPLYKLIIRKNPSARKALKDYEPA